MHKLFTGVLLIAVSLQGMSAEILDPIGFERLWLLNNQRNMFKRYYYYNEKARISSDGLYLIGFDGAPDTRIKTSEGVADAILSRMHIHFQSQRYLFLVDWFSAIPQPQTTEGFSYGDLVLGRTWSFDDNDAFLTLGLRQQSTPRYLVINSETVFNAGSDATDGQFSVFFHYNYRGFDIGTYYSEDNGVEAAAFYLPISKFAHHSFSSTLYYHGESSGLVSQGRYEISLDHELKSAGYSLKSGIMLTQTTDNNGLRPTNIYTDYVSPPLAGLRISAGLYYFDEIETGEGLPGAKIGLLWDTGTDNMRIRFSLQQNAIGDFNTLIIRDEPVLSFALTVGTEGMF